MMSAARMTFIRVKLVARLVSIVVILSFVAFLAVRLATGRGLGLWRVASMGRAVLDSQRVRRDTQGNFANVVFLHHSVGGNLIEQGGVRERLSKAGFTFWDHGYNWEKLRGPDGGRTQYSYLIPDDNTNPDGLVSIFTQPVYGLPLNAFSGLLQHEVIIFKSCFPVSNISSDAQLEQYKSYYLAMRDVMDKHKDRVFVVMTPPPLNLAETEPQAAAKARAFAQWLKSDEFLAGHPNVFTFDLFGYLAEGDPALPDYNMLRMAYREGSDSHPIRVANEKIGPILADFVISATQKYRIAYESGVSGSGQ